MFTGIVIEKGELLDLTDGVLAIGSSLATEGGQVGDSIAVNGACLTITALSEGQFSVDVTPETLGVRTWEMQLQACWLT